MVNELKKKLAGRSRLGVHHAGLLIWSRSRLAGFDFCIIDAKRPGGMIHQHMIRAAELRGSRRSSG